VLSVNQNSNILKVQPAENETAKNATNRPNGTAIQAISVVARLANDEGSFNEWILSIAAEISSRQSFRCRSGPPSTGLDMVNDPPERQHISAITTLNRNSHILLDQKETHTALAKSRDNAHDIPHYLVRKARRFVIAVVLSVSLRRRPPCWVRSSDV